MKNQNFVESLISALKGLGHVLRERNFIIQIIVGVFVFSFALALGLRAEDKIIILILTSFVLATEAMNSACERIMDFITVEHNKEVAHIKEILAAAVLIYSIVAVIVGFMIFGKVLL